MPLAELEPEIGRVLPVAIEVNLPGAGFIDVLLVSEHGRLIVVECKLWRNPQARREVVAQVLDYARELARYGYEDLQRVVSSRTGRRGNVLHDLAVSAGSTLGESQFVDRVSRDLAAGRFLLIIAGDGITEGAQRIGEYLSAQAGLAFDLGMVEIAEYRRSMYLRLRGASSSGVIIYGTLCGRNSVPSSNLHPLVEISHTRRTSYRAARLPASSPGIMLGVAA